MDYKMILNFYLTRTFNLYSVSLFKEINYAPLP